MTEAIIPRWEWRMFAERFGAAERRLASLATAPPQVSDEQYVLGLRSEASVKVRDGLMDVKRLEQVDDHGLEQWRPVMKAAFPLAQADVVTVIEALGASPADLERAEYTVDELVGEVLRPRADVLVLGVHKERVRFTVGGCMAELSELRTEHGATRTVAVESEDPDRVIAAVRELGLVAPHNVSVPRKLKALAGFAARRYAVIDVGTNSVKFHIGERAADGGWRAIVDRADVTRLGQDLESTGRLGDDAIHRTVQAIAGMAEEAARNDVESIVAVGTAGLRLAPNRAELIDAVRHVHGVEVEVIPGDEEARLAYLATASELDVGDGTIVVFDTGGGSSQFTIGRGTHVEERFSLNVGAVRYMERFGLDVIVDEATLTMRSRRSRPISRGWMIGSPSSASSAWAARSRTSPPSSTVSRSTTRRRARHRPRPRRDRSADRALSHARRRAAPGDRRTAGQPGPGHPRGRLHRAQHPRQARPREPHGQRPRPAPRPARRAVPAPHVTSSGFGSSLR